MSSRFVSAGVVDATGDTKPLDGTASKDAETESAETAARKAEWAVVERRLDDERKKREAARKAAPTSSLYDMLQANKEAKQAAFEEAAKLKNQFRALDEDEIEFLDSLKQSERAEAERVQREMAKGIEAFRRARQETSGGTSGGTGGATTVAPGEEVNELNKQDEQDEQLSSRLPSFTSNLPAPDALRHAHRPSCRNLPLVQPSISSSGTLIARAAASASASTSNRRMRSPMRGSTVTANGQIFSLVVLITLPLSSLSSSKTVLVQFFSSKSSAVSISFDLNSLCAVAKHSAATSRPMSSATRRRCRKRHSRIGVFRNPSRWGNCTATAGPRVSGMFAGTALVV
ncbi:nefa-interacting nuclear protein nip30 [Ophiostoma piceae UAMH 11346]|uniref:Nefa-interacting nuclear protein nip30 n=1 Tax=Ophiostoma piceae (strain UAMH 11346) TaxID=1262450 RepID=S3CAY9_OPHP1|nr:nefa-interacting nuclear protein nip30 [Ophiostoma piceae UAMH 11346]